MPKAKTTPPDYTRDCGHIGGHVAEIPRPHVRRYTKKSQAMGIRRPVRCTIANYNGYGGRHYYVTLAEDHNPIWDPRPSWADDNRVTGWTEPWDDHRGKGKTLSGRFNNMLDATRWVRKKVETHFPKETHVIHDNQGRTRWFYREGD